MAGSRLKRLRKNLPPAASRDWLTVPETAALLDCAIGTVKNRILEGALQAIRLPPRGILRISKESVEKLRHTEDTDLTCLQVAQHLRCSRGHVTILIRRGELKAYRRGLGPWRITQAALAQFIARIHDDTT